jgi:hypothetical protein
VGPAEAATAGASAPRFGRGCVRATRAGHWAAALDAAGARARNAASALGRAAVRGWAESAALGWAQASARAGSWAATRAGPRGRELARGWREGGEPGAGPRAELAHEGGLARVG